MEKSSVLSQYNINKKKFLTIRSAIGGAISFLLGRAVIFGIISPFGLSYLAAYVGNNPTKSMQAVIVAILALAGALTAGLDVVFVKYMLAFVLFGLIYIAVTTLTDTRKNFTVAGIAGASLAVSGIVFASQTGFVLYDMIMLGIECAVCIVFTLIIQKSLPMVYTSFGTRQVQIEELIGFYVLLVLSILGFNELSIAGISVGNSLAALVIMVVALVGGVSVGAAGAIGVGLICSLGKFPATEILGVYGFCGLVAGIMSKFNRAGIILGFVVANSALSLYYGGFDGGVFTVFELTLAILLFCSIPKSIIIELEQLITNSRSSNTITQKSIEAITDKLNSISASFGHLATTFSDITKPIKNDNFADYTLLFDKTADKICKRCGLKFICWEREFNSTYDAMTKLVPILKETEKVKVTDVIPYFANKCVKIGEFIGELNRVYGQYKLDMLWQNRVSESKGLVSQQLFGVSKIINNLANEMGKQFTFDTRLENQLYIELERVGIKCSDITAFKNCYGRYEVSIRTKACGEEKKCSSDIIPITSRVLGRQMSSHEDTCGGLQGNGKCTIKLIEKEKYSVTCGAVRRAKDGQTECGDSYSYLPICDGKYVLVLSDGMGCGETAASQSNTTIELLEHFLNAGFDKQSAVKMINSALMIKTSEASAECFATIDITVLDLFSGEAEVIKIGANTTYIKNSKGIKKINSTSLPAGILSSVDMETSRMTFKKDDYIIMLSDGVHSACDNWIEDYLLNNNSTSPQVIADEIINEAIKIKNGKIDDDMTVMVAKIT